ncbi:hypothetical protein L6164_034988 [Bauhinia variegata]|uniref:Uncharacterized protein n=1 Tax=Bauhinia variegata TaxID=167791 RepID=A0ACB9KX39_BAUVA|nr:hypothetical protein L6164_034988 [Bauhinia variegata]
MGFRCRLHATALEKSRRRGVSKRINTYGTVYSQAWPLIVVAGAYTFSSFRRKRELEAFLGNSYTLMDFSESVDLKSGELVSLQDLHPSSPFFKDKASLRVVGKLCEYSAETAIATVADGNVTLKVNVQHLRDLTFQVGSVYQFIGEFLIQPNNEGILRARVGRNVNGIDLNLYHQALLLLRQFQADHLK